ncbi:MAG: SRPBCC family protein [Flavobacteriaceae bacterium]|nr:SRPBCC family protein [Flavobacteriaceae bacterium]
MNLESKKIIVDKSQKDFFEYLSEKIANYKDLMPEMAEKFSATNTSFTLGLKGVPTDIKFVIKEKQPYHKIVLGTESNLDVTLTTIIDKKTENTSEIQILFQGNFNPMMAMMLKNPLQKFIDSLAENGGKLKN